MPFTITDGDGRKYTEKEWRKLYPSPPEDEEDVAELVAEEVRLVPPRPDPVGGVVGFFPTLNGPFTLGHAWCYAAAGFLARKIGAKLLLHCTLGSEYPRSFYARQVGLLTSLILPDGIAFLEVWDKQKQLSSGKLLGQESMAIQTALANRNYQIEIQDRNFVSWMKKWKTVVFREPGGVWYDALTCPYDTQIEDIRLAYPLGIEFEYFIQQLHGVTISVDGMDIARTMLPHWRALAKLLFGSHDLYWDARFMPLIVDPVTKKRISNTQTDPARLAYWELGRWLDQWGPMGLIRLFWAWMQVRPGEDIPGNLEQLIKQFDLARIPWTTEDEPLEIEVDRNRLLWCDNGVG